jgi:hypothetical protein
MGSETPFFRIRQIMAKITFGQELNAMLLKFQMFLFRCIHCVEKFHRDLVVLIFRNFIKDMCPPVFRAGEVDDKNMFHKMPAILF